MPRCIHILFRYGMRVLASVVDLHSYKRNGVLPKFRVPEARVRRTDNKALCSRFTIFTVNSGQRYEEIAHRKLDTIMVRSRTMLIAALAGSSTAQNNTTISISIPSDLAPNLIVPDVYGYSIEPIWLDAYINTSLATTLLTSIANVTKKPAPIRIGGNTADETYLYPSSPLPLTGNDSVALPNLTSANMFNITPRWFDTWAHYFPKDTEIIYSLNFADNSSNWSNAVAQAEAAHAALGESLVAFELGNEIDHFISKSWRPASWGVNEYITQFKTVTDLITSSAWYQTLPNNDPRDEGRIRSRGPTFQAGVFADPPEVPDQHDEIDDFSIVNLTAAGLATAQKEKTIISSYADHLYPQSTCDTARWYRMRLDLLSDHSVLYKNISQYIPEIAAADAAGAPLVIGETNSISCSGKSGISDTFGAALWSIDYVLTAASLGIRKVYFHLGARSEYSAFTPLGYELKNETLESGIRANWYAHYFVARVVKRSYGCSRRDGGMQMSKDRDDGEGEENGRGGYEIAAIPAANSSVLSGFAVSESGHGDMDGRGKGMENGDGDKSSSELRKLVFLDMGVWNGTEGLSNPSTLSATDGTMFSQGKRPTSSFKVNTPWQSGTEVRVIRLTAPGTNAKSNIAVAGTTFDTVTGMPIVEGDSVFGEEYSESVVVGDQGVVRFDMQRAEGALLEVYQAGTSCAGGNDTGGGGGGESDDEGGESGDSGQNETTPRPESRGASSKTPWYGLVTVVLLGALTFVS
ncbi:glycoside hydrolase superfamily [Xylariaceae sp. FL1272]|nr:glycoside hydrolase superfamily [Xylariaceae sp. FL1272]